VAPFLVRELKEFAIALPGHMENLRNLLSGYYKEWFGTELTEIELGFEEALRQFANNSSIKLGAFLRHLWDGSLALVNMVALFVVTPVVAFYLLMDWPKLIANVDSWVPRKHVETVRGLAYQIDRTLNGFMRGQVTVCLLLATFYAIGLMLIGLKHGFLIGVTAGLLSFIPYVGSMVGLLLAGGMAISQYWPEWLPIAMVLGVFVAGQMIEGNILQPKIVGDQVNLHPVWLIFALFVFGYLMGFVGMLVAVPLAATIGVLVRFALGQYLKSDIYQR
jgi:predicted PurR-regulated permease PerM